MNIFRHPSFFTRNGMVHHMKKLWILIIIFSFFAVASGCNESGLTSAGLSPEVISTIPAANADNVPVNTSISVTFSDAMDSTTIHEGTFIVKIDTVNISGTVRYSDLTAVFTPSIPLGYGITYSVLINSSVKSVSGTTMEDSHEWSFSTEEGLNADTPQVISTNPAHNADDVQTNSDIKVSFNKPMNSNSLNTTTFTVYQGSTPISGIVTSTSSTATFSPINVLSKGSTYRAVISSDVEDTLGNKLGNDFAWSFTTLDDQEGSTFQIESVSPTDGEQDVRADVVISASFNNALDNATVNSSTFKVAQNGNSISGSIDLSGSTLSFTPNTALPYEAEVTAVVTTGVKDEPGNSLPADYEWSFVIMDEPDTTPPQIQSVSPSDGEQNVPVDVVISASFSEALDPASVNSSTFRIKQNGKSVNGSIHLSGSTLSFTPHKHLPYEAVITAILTTDIKDKAGNSLSADYEWNFMVMDKPDNSSPKVVSTIPAANAKDVDVNSVITATFSEPMNESTINNSTIHCKQTRAQKYPRVLVILTIRLHLLQAEIFEKKEPIRLPLKIVLKI
ncbi:MAG: Ig-like domain-containing protein [Gracilimonas sp.]|nr:Ig-like domain-containing protein [Gracilimonas sp.]